jgi:hypothetical protein
MHGVTSRLWQRKSAALLYQDSANAYCATAVYLQKKNHVNMLEMSPESMVTTPIEISPK